MVGKPPAIGRRSPKAAQAISRKTNYNLFPTALLMGEIPDYRKKLN
jgi:hypothetical protein